MYPEQSLTLSTKKIVSKFHLNKLTNRDSRQRPLATCFGIFDVASDRPNIKLFRRVARTLIASILSDIITKFFKTKPTQLIIIFERFGQRHFYTIRFQRNI